MGKRTKFLVGGGVTVVVLLGFFAFEPVTRNVIATDELCSYCHVKQEYQSTVRLAYSKPHPSLSVEKGDGTTNPKPQARCVECHLPQGPWNSLYAYTHFASLTDLFGSFRHRTAERSGMWMPPRQAAAYRVRDGLFESDSITCRGCHEESKIEPKRVRGQNAHKKALDEQMTCIECHYNEKHPNVDLRKNAFAKK